jgi:hypothetical protein
MFPKKNNKEEILLMLRLMRNAYGLFSNIDHETMHYYVVRNFSYILEAT